MARTLLDYCISEPAKPLPKQEAKAQATPPPEAAKHSASQERRRNPAAFPPVAPMNLPASYFVSASYDGRQKKAVIKLYEPESGQIYFWYDNTGHKPYCLTNLSKADLEKIERVVHHEGFDHIETCQKIGSFSTKKLTVIKNRHRRPLSHRGQTLRHYKRHHPCRIFRKFLICQLQRKISRSGNQA